MSEKTAADYLRDDIEYWRTIVQRRQAALDNATRILRHMEEQLEQTTPTNAKERG